MTAARIDFAELNALFAPYDRTDAPGYAVGVAVPGVRPYRRGFGMASIELPITLSPTIRMRIGSTTKHFTALAIMLLVEDGRLSLEDSPRLHLPELPAWAEAMTLRQLLAHTSGMRDSLDLVLHSAGPGKPAPADFHLRYLASLDSVNFAPGTSWNYNNGGYVLAAEIIERVSGRSFADFLRERIFEPIGMHDTLVRALDTDLVPNSATLHVPSPVGGYVRGVFGAPIGGEGGIVSTVDDMLLWLRHMSMPNVGTPESWREIRTPLTTHGYGLGLSMDQHRGLQRLKHAGAVVGGSCQMIKVLDPELDIIILSNGRSSLEGYKLADEIIDRCILDLPPPPLNAPGITVTGDYYSAETGRHLRLGELEGNQMITLGAITLPARRDDAGELTLPYLPTDIRVIPSTDGAYLDVREFGGNERLHRVIPAADTSVANIAGCYASRAASLTATIAQTGGDTIEMTIAGPLGVVRYALTPITAALWEARATDMLPFQATMEFGETGFCLTTGRTLRLSFDRVT